MIKLFLLVALISSPLIFTTEEKLKIPIQRGLSEKLKMCESVSVVIPGAGTLLINSNIRSPILIVFGGIPVSGVESGVYMWKYLESIKGDYHVFVAKNSRVQGNLVWDLVSAELTKHGVSLHQPKILYLFSGGWRPGKSVLESKGADFQKVVLVDIWMKSRESSNFYIDFCRSNREKVFYYYTKWGHANSQASLKIIDLVVESKIQSGENSHMNCNFLAVESLRVD